jgi:hypothetical protein
VAPLQRDRRRAGGAHRPAPPPGRRRRAGPRAGASRCARRSAAARTPRSTSRARGSRSATTTSAPTRCGGASRRGPCPIAGYVQQDRFHLDFRAVLDDDLPEIQQALDALGELPDDPPGTREHPR